MLPKAPTLIATTSTTDDWPTEQGGRREEEGGTRKEGRGTRKEEGGGRRKEGPRRKANR